MKRIVAFCVMALAAGALLCAGGCGGKSEKQPENRIQENLAERTGLDDVQESELEEPAEEPKPEETAEEEPAERVLPEDFTQWTREDFLHAKQTQFKDLEKALESLAAVPAEKAEDAAGTLALLIARPELPAVQPAEEVPPAEETKPAENTESEEDTEDGEEAEEEEFPEEENGHETAPEPVEPEELLLVQLTQQQLKAALDALLSLDVPAARETLQKVVRRELLTDDDKAAVEQILDAYIQRAADGALAKADEDFLLQITLFPMQVRPALPEPEAEAPRDSRNQDLLEIAPGEFVRIRYSNGNNRATDVTYLDLQSRVFEKYRQLASPEFRVEVAKFLTGADGVTVPPEYLKDEKLQQMAQKFLDFLLEKNFRNVEAQVLLYQAGTALDEQARKKLDENLLAVYKDVLRLHVGALDEKMWSDFQAAQAEQLAKEAEAKAEAEDAQKSNSGSLLGTISKESPARTPAARGNSRSGAQHSDLVEMMLDPEAAQKVQTLLWSEGMQKSLGKNLAEAFAPFEALMAPESAPGGNTRPQVRFEAQGFLPAQMYLSIPKMEVRRNLYKLMTQFWMVGPDALQQSLFDKIETEPGLMMVVKSLERRELPKSAKSAKKAKDPSKAPALSPAKLAAEMRQNVAARWMDGTYNLVAKWCLKLSKFEADKRVAEGRQVSNLPPEPVADSEEIVPSGTAQLPEKLAARFPLPEEAVTISYCTKFDVDEAGKRDKDGFSLAFFEVECTTRTAALISAWKKKNPGLTERGEFGAQNSRDGLHGLWFESFERNSDTGVRESLDVILVPTAPQPSNNASEEPKKKKNAEESVHIYVLMMRMPDVTGDSAASDKSAEKAGSDKPKKKRSKSESTK